MLTPLVLLLRIRAIWNNAVFFSSMKSPEIVEENSCHSIITFISYDPRIISLESPFPQTNPPVVPGRTNTNNPIASHQG